jgi:hypothetical protein
VARRRARSAPARQVQIAALDATHREPEYRALDWSLGGFRIGPFHRRLGLRETLTGTIESLAGLLREPFEADITRLTEAGEVCCRFLVLPKAVLQAMAETDPR